MTAAIPHSLTGVQVIYMREAEIEGLPTRSSPRLYTSQSVEFSVLAAQRGGRTSHNRAATWVVD